MMTTLVANMLMCLLGALAIGFIFGYLIARAFAKQKHAIEVEDLNKIIDKKDADNRAILEDKSMLNSELLQVKKDAEIHLKEKDENILSLKSDLEGTKSEVSQKVEELKNRDSGISLLQMGLVSAKSKMEKQSKDLTNRDSGISLLNVGLVAAKDKIKTLEKKSEKLKSDVDARLKREKELSREKDKLNSKISLLDKDLKLKKEEAVNLQNKVKELDDKVVHNSVLEKTYKTLNLDPKDDSIKQMENKIIEAKTKVEDLENVVLEKDNTIKIFEEKVAIADTKVKELQKEVSLKSIAIKTLEEKDEKIKSKLEKLEKVVAEKDETLKEFKNKVDVTIEKVHDLEESVAQKESKLESIENSKEVKVGHFLVGGGLFAGAKKVFDSMRGQSGEVDRKVDEVIEDYKKKNEKEKVELIESQIAPIKNKKPGLVTDIKTLGIKGASKKIFRSAPVREAEINEQADKVLTEYKLANSIGVEQVLKKVNTPKPDTSNVEVQKVKIKTQKVEVETSDIEVPKVEIKTPSVEVNTPDVKTPKVESNTLQVETPKTKSNDVDIADIAKVGLVAGAVSISKKVVDEIENKVEEVKIDTPNIEAPEVEISEVKVDTPNIEVPEVEIPEVKVDTPNIEVPEVEIPEVKIDTPNIEVPEVEIPEVKIDTPSVEAPEVEIPEVKIDTPSVDVADVAKVGLVAGAVGISKKVADEIKIKVEELNRDRPETEIETPKVKIDTPSIKVSELDIKAAKVEINTPEIEISKVKSNDIDISDVAKVGLSASAVGISKKIADELTSKVEEVKIPKVEVDTSDIKSPEVEIPKVSIVDHVVVKESLINRESVNTKLYIEDLKKYEDDDIDEKLLANVINVIEPSIYGKNWKIISCSKKVDLAIIREEFLKKVLNLSDSNRQLDRVIKEVCKKLKNAKRKNRVTVYYLLAKKYDRSSF